MSNGLSWLTEPRWTPPRARSKSTGRCVCHAPRDVCSPRLLCSPFPVTRHAWRPGARFSAPLADALFARAAADGLALPPKSALGQAVGYLLAQRAPLTRCITTSDARLDNNAVENAIRPLKLGAKNWLFVGHPDAGPRLPHLFTLVENARQAGIDIEAYLTALLTQLPDHSVRRLGDWLPRAWRQREHAARQVACALGLTA